MCLCGHRHTHRCTDIKSNYLRLCIVPRLYLKQYTSFESYNKRSFELESIYRSSVTDYGEDGFQREKCCRQAATTEDAVAVVQDEYTEVNKAMTVGREWRWDTFTAVRRTG